MTDFALLFERAAHLATGW